MPFEKMLDRENPPAPEKISAYTGKAAARRLEKLEQFISENYEMTKSLQFPFGNNYGWGYKYGNKKTHICYVFFESGAFTVMIQIGKNGAGKLDENLRTFLPKTQELWTNRYPCGGGGWIHYRVLSEDELRDVFELIRVKTDKMPAGI
ncbi:DUF3788 domain-containing protein [Brucepastera parasyntrophica]|uniref:DUF3788 domain-containing protein n=1 Tax=Brucepastera parasyntrophica TaxID=2880008 RepID=UPI00210CBC5D|nr:DUF3788 domain-containing protein [Brucepastera parasyntrophica]ULQ58715.1 DUF3788 domain-containing protein [Brucepastera parasyntrophica]